MDFIWDTAKRQINLKKHRLDFADAERVCSGETFTFEDDRFAYGQQRFISMGLLRGDVIIIVHAETEETIRIISMRRAEKHEQRLYFSNLSS
ncbi:MAG: BrnT family toxin [Candidatus Competibacteraceae bacterium]|nr:BrnT family toxin [Candidatus Competibacteraceae bacterium]MBK7983007.1 BrnT family toxin [Candidatus Competibacteraceae bacterium]MBK8898441.1 BrnT family toxin [Candidatus Competibacteraceae bacterium]